MIIYKMSLYDQIAQLRTDASQDLTPECCDRLILIAWHAAKKYDQALAYDVQIFEDYFERWGTCYDRFWDLLSKCEAVCGPADAEIYEEEDEGEEITTREERAQIDYWDELLGVAQ